MRQKRIRRTPELEEEICLRLAQGASLETVAKGEGMPSKTAMVRWRRTDPVFRAMTDAARQAGAEARLLGHAVLAGRIGGVEVYTPELGRRICDLIMQGAGWRELMARRDLPHMDTIYKWLGRHPEFREAFGRAVQVRAQVLGDDVVRIADEAAKDEVSLAKLRADVRRWRYASLMAAKAAEEAAQKSAEKTAREGEPQSYMEALREILKRRAERARRSS
jgi:hypothetical protein